MFTWALISLAKSVMKHEGSMIGDFGCLLFVALIADAFIVFVIGQIIIKLWGC